MSSEDFNAGIRRWHDSCCAQEKDYVVEQCIFVSKMAADKSLAAPCRSMCSAEETADRDSLWENCWKCERCLATLVYVGLSGEGEFTDRCEYDEFRRWWVKSTTIVWISSAGRILNKTYVFIVCTLMLKLCSIYIYPEKTLLVYTGCEHK